MRTKMRFNARSVPSFQVVCLATSICAVSICTVPTARAQQPGQQSAQQPVQTASNPALRSLPGAAPDTPPPAPEARPEGLTQSAQAQPTGTMTLSERFVYESHTTFGPLAFIVPAFGAGYTMIHPPDNYPRDWTDGAAAFGRNYGAEFGTNSVDGLTHFATAAILHEDARYYPAASTRFAARVAHAVAFTVIDRANSGRSTLAVSNFIGAAAGGFAGMAWEPDGFNDIAHALQRALLQVAGAGAHNLLAEFDPEIHRIKQKFHLARSHDDASLMTPSWPAQRADDPSMK